MLMCVSLCQGKGVARGWGRFMFFMLDGFYVCVCVCVKFVWCSICFCFYVSCLSRWLWLFAHLFFVHLLYLDVGLTVDACPHLNIFSLYYVRHLAIKLFLSLKKQSALMFYPVSWNNSIKGKPRTISKGKDMLVSHPFPQWKLYQRKPHRLNKGERNVLVLSPPSCNDFLMGHQTQ